MVEQRSWAYAAESVSGEIARGAITADDLAAAARRLRARGLKPFELNEQKPGRLFRLSFARSRDALSNKDWTAFTSRMSELLNAGIPVAAALTLIARQAPKQRFGIFAKRIATRLRQGERFSAILADDKAGASRLMTALVSTGEALGDLGGQFARLKSDFEARATLRRELIGNLIYPAALFVLIILTLIFLSFFVLPQFETVFATSGTKPPAETRFVLAAGAFVRQWWSVLFAGLIGAAIAVRFFARRYRESWDRIALLSPLIGSLLHQSDTARYCRSLGALLDGGTHLARAMPIAVQAAASREIRERLARVERDVRSGGALSIALKKHAAVTGEAIDFIELGEHTGMLGKMVLRAADFADQRLASVLKKFAALSGPIMTAIMGLLTAGVIAAVMSGVLSLNDAVY